MDRSSKKTYFIIIIILFIILNATSVLSNSSFGKNVFLQKAAEYYRANMLDKAITLYLEVLKKDPYNFNALINLSAAYIKKHSFSEAYPYVKRLIQKYPNRPDGWINMAIVEIGLGRLKDAMNYLNMAEKIIDCPKFRIYLHKGIILSKMGKLEEALKYYKKAELLDSNNPSLIFNIALLYDKKGDYQQALIYYEIYLQRYKNISSFEKDRIERRIERLRAKFR